MRVHRMTTAAHAAHDAATAGLLAKLNVVNFCPSADRPAHDLRAGLDDEKCHRIFRPGQEVLIFAWLSSDRSTSNFRIRP